MDANTAAALMAEFEAQTPPAPQAPPADPAALMAEFEAQQDQRDAYDTMHSPENLDRQAMWEEHLRGSMDVPPQAVNPGAPPQAPANDWPAFQHSVQGNPAIPYPTPPVDPSQVTQPGLSMPPSPLDAEVERLKAHYGKIDEQKAQEGQDRQEAFWSHKAMPKGDELKSLLEDKASGFEMAHSQGEQVQEQPDGTWKLLAKNSITGKQFVRVYDPRDARDADTIRTWLYPFKRWQEEQAHKKWAAGKKHGEDEAKIRAEMGKLRGVKGRLAGFGHGAEVALDVLGQTFRHPLGGKRDYSPHTEAALRLADERLGQQEAKGDKGAAVDRRFLQRSAEPGIVGLSQFGNLIDTGGDSLGARLGPHGKPEDFPWYGRVGLMILADPAGAAELLKMPAAGVRKLASLAPASVKAEFRAFSAEAKDLFGPGGMRPRDPIFAKWANRAEVGRAARAEAKAAREAARANRVHAERMYEPPDYDAVERAADKGLSDVGAEGDRALRDAIDRINGIDDELARAGSQAASRETAPDPKQIEGGKPRRIEEFSRSDVEARAARMREHLQRKVEDGAKTLDQDAKGWTMPVDAPNGPTVPKGLADSMQFERESNRFWREEYDEYYRLREKARSSGSQRDRAAAAEQLNRAKQAREAWKIDRQSAQEALDEWNHGQGAAPGQPSKKALRKSREARSARKPTEEVRKTYRVVDDEKGIRLEPSEKFEKKAKPLGKPVGEPRKIYDSENREWEVTPHKVDIDDLKVSLEKGEFQTRDRTTGAERDAIDELAAKFDKSRFRDTWSATPTEGAPTVWFDKRGTPHVIAGNGRTAAARKVGVTGEIPVRVFKGTRKQAQMLSAASQESSAGAQTYLGKARAQARSLGMSESDAPTHIPKGGLNDRTLGEFIKKNPTFAKKARLTGDAAQNLDRAHQILAGLLPESVHKAAKILGPKFEESLAGSAPRLLSMRALARARRIREEYDVLGLFERAAKILAQTTTEAKKASISRYAQRLQELSEMRGGMFGKEMGLNEMTKLDVGFVLGMRAISARANPAASMNDALRSIEALALKDNPRQLGMFGVRPEIPVEKLLEDAFGKRIADAVKGWRGSKEAVGAAAGAGDDLLKTGAPHRVRGRMRARRPAGGSGKVADTIDIYRELEQKSGASIQSGKIDLKEAGRTDAQRDSAYRVRKLREAFNKAKGDPIRRADLAIDIQDELDVAKNLPDSDLQQATKAYKKSTRKYNAAVRKVSRARATTSPALFPGGNQQVQAAKAARRQAAQDLLDAWQKLEDQLPQGIAEVGEWFGRRGRAYVADAADVATVWHEVGETMVGVGKIEAPAARIQGMLRQFAAAEFPQITSPSWQEGAAELFAQWGNFDDLSHVNPTLRTWADGAFKRFNKARKMTMRRASATGLERLTAAQAPPGGESLRKRIGTKAWVTYHWDKFRTMWIDSMAAAKSAMKRAKIKDLPDDLAHKDWRQVAEATRGSESSRATGWFLHGDFRSPTTGAEFSAPGHIEIASDAAKAGKDGYEDLLKYFRAKQTSAIQSLGKKTKTTFSEALDAAAEIESKYPQQSPFWDAVKKLQRHQEATVDIARDYEVISAETAKTLKEKYPFYSSMSRDLLPALEEMYGAKTGGGGGVFKTLFGSQRHKVLDPLEAAYKHDMEVIMGAERMALKRLFVEQVEAGQNPLTAKLLQPAGEAPKAVADFVQEYSDTLRRAGVVFDPAAQDEILGMIANIPTLVGADANVMNVVKDGKVYRYIIDPLVRTSVEGLPAKHWRGVARTMKAIADEIPGISKALKAAGKVKRAGTINYSPSFMVRNAFMRDPIETLGKRGWVEGAKILKDGWKSGVLKAGHYKDVMEKLVKLSGAEGMTLSGARGVQAELARAARKMGIVSSAPRTVLDGISSMIMRTELGPRLGAGIDALVKAGWNGGTISPAQWVKAVNAMSEITTNFRASGLAGKSLNKIKFLWNARLQGQVNQFRYLTQAKSTKELFKRWGRVASVYTAIDAANFAVNQNDKKWRAIPEPLQAFAWWWRIPGTKRYFPFPRVGIFGEVFGYPLGAGLRAARSSADTAGKKEALQQATNELVGFDTRILTSGVTGGLKRAAVAISPTVVEPMTEVAINLDTFTGNPIDAPWDIAKGKRDEQRFKATTPDVYKKVGELTGMSPNVAQHLFESAVGTLGREAVRTLDLIGRGEFPDDPKRVPFLGSLVGQPIYQKWTREVYAAQHDAHQIEDENLRKRELREIETFVRRHVKPARRLLKDATSTGERVRILQMLEKDSETFIRSRRRSR